MPQYLDFIFGKSWKLKYLVSDIIEHADKLVIFMHHADSIS